ncbi:hypothetical protein [Algoriphagus aquimarinus]|uniref:hypothetical protein n=1 Tax=Algoriphagus aquimarinus TaxID=237018 RepID=UPI0030DD4CE4|tara:strand:+ start:615 stop:1115 length:501 start_codon:yes stop_codon:yes gene_type:complete
MLRILRFGYVLILSVVLISCDSREPVSIDYTAELEEVALEANLQPGEILTAIDLTRVFTKNEWDSIIVIKPYAKYTHFKKLDLENNSDVRFILREMQFVDHHYYLLFVQENEITAYAKMNNFHRLAVTDNGFFPVISRSNPTVSLIRLKDDPDFYQFQKVSNQKIK